MVVVALLYQMAEEAEEVVVEGAGAAALAQMGLVLPHLRLSLHHLQLRLTPLPCWVEAQR